MKRTYDFEWHRDAAEFLATFCLTFSVLLGLSGVLPVATPVAAAITLGIFVYTIGSISGAHINPAVTAGMWSVGKIKQMDAARYIVAQLLGALLARQVFIFAGGSLPGLIVEDTVTILLAEAGGAFLLVFGVSAVVYGMVDRAASGLVIGGSLLLGILMSLNFSNGVLNPAVAVGIGSISAFYIVAPLLGGMLAAQLYHVLAGAKK